MYLCRSFLLYKLFLYSRRHFLESFFQDQLYRAVVASHNLCPNIRFRNKGCDSIRHKKIIDAPAGIFLPGMEHIAPPAVNARCIRMQISECIRKPRGKQLCHFGALFIAESCISTVGFWIFSNLFPDGRHSYRHIQPRAF